MSDYAPLLAALIAFLVGLTIGKAWERYKLRGGKWIDRRRARESPHYILGLNFLVSNQIDLAIEELTRASVDADALEVHMIPGNRTREGTGRQGDHDASGTAAALEAESCGARIRPACLGLDYKRGVRRACVRGFTEVLRLIQNETRCSICRSLMKTSTSGPKPMTRASALPSWPRSTRGRRARPFWRSSRTRWGSRRCAARTSPKPRAGSGPRSISTPAQFPRISTSATCASRKATKRKRRAYGSSSCRWYPIGRIWPSIDWRRWRAGRIRRSGSPGCAGGSSRTTRRTGGRAGVVEAAGRGRTHA